MKLQKIVAGLLACSVMYVSVPDVSFMNYNSISAKAVYEMSEADNFLSGAINLTQGQLYDGNVETDKFEMNGRTYYTGILFNTTNYSSNVTSQVSFNVKNVKTFDCVFGHIDNGRTGNATVLIYLDDVLEDKFGLTSTIPIEDYTVDVSKASMIKMEIVREGGSAYAMADLKIDGVSSAKDYVVPSYKKSELFIDDSFNCSALKFVNAVSESDTFEMNGRTYYTGVLFNETDYSSDVTSRIDFNVENVDDFSCTFGHIDNGRTGSAEVAVYLNDVLVEKFNLTSTMPLKDYSLDVSDASIMRFSILRKSGSAYAMANVSVNGIEPAKKIIVPEYKKPENFVDDAFNCYGLEMVDAVSDYDTFEMNGRIYYKGVLFNTTDYSSDVTSRIDFNVENVNDFSCTFGHIDNGRTGSAEVSVYLDDVLIDKFNLTSTMPLKDYSLDVSEFSTMRFSILRKSGSAYAMANVSVNGVSPAKKIVVPEYEKSENFVDDAFNRYELEMVDAVSDFDTFEMNGRMYYKGILFNTTDYSSDVTSRVDFNVENVDDFLCTFGHIDNGRTGNAEVSVYLDDVLIDKFNLTSTMPLKDYWLDVSNASTMRFSILRKSGSAYAMADVSVNGILPAKKVVIPTYESSKKFMADAYNLKGGSVCDVVSDYDAFSMNGNIYHQGILLNETNYSSDVTSRIDFNVENVKDISFDIAHIDEGKTGNGTVSVYLDDVLTEKFEITSDMATNRYKIDVSYADNIRFEVLRKSGAAYAFADFEITSDSNKSDNIMGDANEDGKVNIADAVMLQKWLTGSGKLSNWKNVDLCKDGKIDVFDMIMLKRLILKK